MVKFVTTLLVFVVLLSGRAYGASVDMFPLPENDFEVSYEDGGQTLRYRFRSDKVGKDGQRDQQADQRFISRLVESGTFNIDIDMSSPKVNPVRRRVVELPASIYLALNQRQVSLRIVSGALRITIPPNALEVAEFAQLHDFGRGSRVLIGLELNPANTPFLEHGQGYSVQPQQLFVHVETPSHRQEISSFAQEIEIEIAASIPRGYSENNFGIFWGSSGHYWQPLDGTFSRELGAFRASSHRGGMFALITNKP